MRSKHLSLRLSKQSQKRRIYFCTQFLVQPLIFLFSVDIPLYNLLCCFGELLMRVLNSTNWPGSSVSL
uniref:Uncharacterized protein n=1 Tax=Rhizophora mucronata TaxID=61149 RepID=A0A2P2NI89_RHIMU